MCTPEQVESEFRNVLDLVQYMAKCLGIDKDITYRFSKWDPNNKKKYIDMPEAWEQTEAAMKTILDHIGLNYTEEKDEAAFYGPKQDIQFKNVFGKEDTCLPSRSTLLWLSGLIWCISTRITRRSGLLSFTVPPSDAMSGRWPCSSKIRWRAASLDRA